MDIYYINLFRQYQIKEKINMEDLDNRMRFPLEVFEEVVKVSNNLPIGMRITGTEWEENGIEIEDALVFSKQLKNLGCDYVCVSSGVNTKS